MPPSTREACPLGLAPTASTTAALALGDALALAVLDARGFSMEDFARSHPGGALGRRLLTRVADVMRPGSALPRVADTATLAEAIVEMSAKGMGMTVVVREHDKVAGIFTDGDLRRASSRRRSEIGARRRPDDADAAHDRRRPPCRRLHRVDGNTAQGHVAARRRCRRHAGRRLHLHDLFRARVV